LELQDQLAVSGVLIARLKEYDLERELWLSITEAMKKT
jgi:hypothetical protein